MQLILLLNSCHLRLGDLLMLFRNAARKILTLIFLIALLLFGIEYC